MEHAQLFSARRTSSLQGPKLYCLSLEACSYCCVNRLKRSVARIWRCPPQRDHCWALVLCDKAQEACVSQQTVSGPCVHCSSSVAETSTSSPPHAVAWGLQFAGE